MFSVFYFEQLDFFFLIKRSVSSSTAEQGYVMEGPASPWFKGLN